MLKLGKSWENWNELVTLSVDRIMAGEVGEVNVTFLSWCTHLFLTVIL